MKIQITKTDFRNAFKETNRQDNFTPYGLGKLFDYLKDYEEQTDEEMELDVIALCCEFSEYESFEELQQDYDVPDDFKETQKYLEQRTQVVCFEEDCILIQNY